MFQSLSDRLSGALKRIRGRSTISQADLDSTLKEVRLALLEADVNFKVAKDFCAEIADAARGEAVMKSLAPDQQIIKIVHEKLTAMMGAQASELNLRVAPPVVIMMVGLQGSGKTTTSGKLAALLRKQYKRRPLLVSADVYRPAAIEQLATLGRQLDIPVCPSLASERPVVIAHNALTHARNHGLDTLIIDTAGRLQIDDQLMNELVEIKQLVSPHEILLVADSMTGQEAVNVARGFDQRLDISGLVLTKLDGDARGGAALSMRAVTGKPIKFIGVSEKMDGLEVFHPERMASRILGMGDVLSLIEKASQQVNVEDTIDLHKKIKKNEFSLEDFLDQMKMIKRMGSISSLAGMIPGMGKLMKQVDEGQAESEMQRIEAIILSMTKKERRDHAIVNGSRRKRIALGSGTSVEEVNKLLKQFNEMKKMMGAISKMGMGNMMGMLGGKLPAGLGGLLKR